MQSAMRACNSRIPMPFRHAMSSSTARLPAPTTTTTAHPALVPSGYTNVSIHSLTWSSPGIGTGTVARHGGRGALQGSVAIRASSTLAPAEGWLHLPSTSSTASTIFGRRLVTALHSSQVTTATETTTAASRARLCSFTNVKFGSRNFCNTSTRQGPRSSADSQRSSLPQKQHQVATRLEPEYIVADGMAMPAGPPHMYAIVQTPTLFQALIKPVAFTFVASAGCFALGAYVWERRQVSLLKRIQAWRARPRHDRPTAQEFIQAQREELQEKWTRILDRFRWIQEIGVPLEVQKAIVMARHRWREYTPGERTVWGIIAVNSVVFGAWQVPRLLPFMQKWFTHNPARGLSITLLTSMFSHQAIWHFGLNMFALYSFGAPLHDALGREQFLAFYLSAGMAASLASHLFTVARVPWAKMLPSVGASGALFACLGVTAYLRPDASVYIIFLPHVPFKITTALGGMMALDLAGIIRGWKTFDHCAHLAGATLGLAYMHYGQDWIWKPMQQRAIELNNDSSVFTPTYTNTSTTPNREPTRPSNSYDSEHRSAKEVVGDSLKKSTSRVKAWWDNRKSGRGGGSSSDE